MELHNYTADDEYLDLVKKHVTEALKEFSPNLIVYNAGTDVLSGDPLGLLEISKQVTYLKVTFNLHFFRMRLLGKCAYFNILKGLFF